MLSSTMVTVLAPHWNGRLRRSKRFEGTSNLDARGETSAAANRANEEETVNRSPTDGSVVPLRTTFLNTRRSRMSCSASVPAFLDHESKRAVPQTASLDVNSGSTDNMKGESGTRSPVSPILSYPCPRSLDQPEQRVNPQAGRQGLPLLTIKPTSSSLLLSLRKSNSIGRNHSVASTLSETNPQSILPKDQNGQLLTKPLLSPSRTSYRTKENAPVLSPLPFNHRDTTIFVTQLSTDSYTNQDTPFAPHSQAEVSASSVSSPRRSPFEHSSVPKTHPVPRRTTLTSTSWWKQVTQDSGSSLQPTDTTNIMNKSNTHLASPANGKSDLPSPGMTCNKSFNNQIVNNRCSNNTTVSILKTQGETCNTTQRKSADSPGLLFKQQIDPQLNIREPQKAHSLPGVSSIAKISSASPQTLSHLEGFTKDHASNRPITTNPSELPSLLPNPKSLNTPTERWPKYNNHCSSETSHTPTFSQNTDPQNFSKSPLFIATNNALNRQALDSKTTPVLPIMLNTSSLFSSDALPLHSNIQTVSNGCTSAETPKITKPSKTSPLGFERSYASIPKHFHTKTVSSLISTVSSYSKTNKPPSVSTVSTISSSTTDNHSANTTVHSPSHLTPPVTPALPLSPTTVTSILLTPPSTPVSTSPNYSKPSSLKEGMTLSNRQEKDIKRQHPHSEGKKVRHVTWEDSVDLQQSQQMTLEKPEKSHVPLKSPSPSRPSPNTKPPFIFSFLRSSSPSPICSPSPKSSSILVGKPGKYRSLSSDSADLASRQREKYEQTPSSCMVSDQGGQSLSTSRHERTLSLESGTVQCHTSASLSLLPDFSSGYKLRYSSTPYTALMSSRSTQREARTIAPRSLLLPQPTQSNHTQHLSIHTDPVEVTASPVSEHALSPVSLPQPISLPFQTETTSGESSVCEISVTDQVNNNDKNKSQSCQNGQVVFVNNRVHASPLSPQADKVHGSSQAFTTETLIYSIKRKADLTTPEITLKCVQHSANTPDSMETMFNQQLVTVQNHKATHHSDQVSSGGSSTDSQSPDDGSRKRGLKENVLIKSKFFSVESRSEQSQKRSRFALKKSVSTPNSTLSRSDSDRSNKTNNKMDQVLNRLRQTFSTRRSEDDTSFPWKWKRTSQTPNVIGSSDVSSISDSTVRSTLENQEKEDGVLLSGSEKETEVVNRYTLITPSVAGNTKVTDQFYMQSDKSAGAANREEQNTCAEHLSINQSHMTHSPTTHQFLSYRDPSPGRGPGSSAAYPAHYGKSTPSPRSPFSPFSSLSPLSSFPSADVTDDVFYSPKLPRRRESVSPCEPGEGFNLRSSRRSRASTGPPSVNPGQENEYLALSCADLKYGIEPGRSFSVSSVLSSRPSGPGRISTGSRFMSVGNLVESALTCRGNGEHLDQWLINPDWTQNASGQPSKAFQIYHGKDPVRMRSRSLPRSLTKCFTNWSAGISALPPGNIKTPKPNHILSPTMSSCHFPWNTEGPLTPPPTPPLSPVSRRMSKPPSLSSPTSPSSSGPPQQLEGQSSRGNLPSKVYKSSLSTFEESSDSSSDTTTDDEYYLETVEDEEKETEL